MSIPADLTDDIVDTELDDDNERARKATTPTSNPESPVLSFPYPVEFDLTSIGRRFAAPLRFITAVTVVVVVILLFGSILPSNLAVATVRAVPPAPAPFFASGPSPRTAALALNLRAADDRIEGGGDSATNGRSVTVGWTARFPRRLAAEAPPPPPPGLPDR